tara:strand:+ start:291 stop:668 length:378 start_codon:yes stop_codon:yes gene_type:complete
MQINLTLQTDINISLSPGDTVWYTASGTSIKGYYTANKSGIVKLGTVESIDKENKIIEVSRFHDPADPNVVPPTLGPDHFLMFSKPNSFNTSGLKGYYAEVRLDNNSTEKVELFAVGSEISQSSK